MAVNNHHVKLLQHPAMGDGSSSFPGSPVDSRADFPGGRTNAEFQQSTNMANHEENENQANKTPMCILNERSRCNGITPQYNLIDECGQAHDKTFTIELTVGDDKFRAEGKSLKATQQAVASKALSIINLPQPPPKKEKPKKVNPGALTPTVQLNSELIKLGYKAVYKILESPTPAFPPPDRNRSYYDRNQNRYQSGYGGPNQYSVNMSCGPGQLGYGNYADSRMCSNYTPNYNSIHGQRGSNYGGGHRGSRGRVSGGYNQPKRMFHVTLLIGDRQFLGEGPLLQKAKHDAATKALGGIHAEPLPETDSAVPSKVKEEPLENSDVKSGISQIYEAGMRWSWPVNFEVQGDEGKPHNKLYTIKCTLGNDYVGLGHGKSKRVARSESALAVLKQLPPSILKSKKVAPQRQNRNRLMNRKKSNSLIRQVTDEYGLGMNAVSRLIQICQAKKLTMPTFNVSENAIDPQHKLFTISISVDDKVAEATDKNKKEAKRKAADNMLELLGFRTAAADIKTILSSSNGDAQGVVSQNIYPSVDSATEMTQSATNVTTATIARELMMSGMSTTAETLSNNGTTPGSLPKLSRPKQQLMYLASKQKIKVQFTQLGNKENAIESMVAVHTCPPIVARGVSASLDKSNDIAALTALTSLSELGSAISKK